ncbi:MAG TPA: NUDIX domain-containing protein [Kiritimatiellia bacterium]|nr:NUDIX domain-containing protein [Kiritimatiellia bacterium]HPS06962.1 NUDIX domain-containing protein [Kiritimatiellia bacterium]
MYENANVEVIARGVCVVDGQLLLCHGKKAALTYLPGGHIEFRETARQALVREIREELGRDAQAGRFLGCCEHCFVQKDEPHAEINLVFELNITGLKPGAQVDAAEDWIGFRWQPLDQLDEANLEPAPFRKCIAEWRKRPGGHFVSGDAWNQREG